MAEAGGYKIRNQNAVHFITFALVEWIELFNSAGIKGLMKLNF